MKSILKFEKEASEWLEALPIGNGSLGGMVYGGIQSECVALNEESFWAGYPQDNHRPEILGYLEKARQCIKQNDDMQAQEIVEHHMLSKFTQPYQPLGTLRMEFAHTDKVIGYERTLNMNNGMVEVKYQTDTTEYTREYFCSYPSQVMAIKLSANGQENLDFSVAVDSLCKYHVEHLSGQELYMETKAPSEVRIKDVYEFPEDSEIVYDDRETIHGHMALTVVPVDGEAVQDDKGIRISGCKECFIYLTATTSYKEKDGKSWCIQLLEALLEKKYDEIKEEHVKDFSDLFERVSLELNPENEIAENRVTELLFQFGRYLLISSSRKGGLPANLQGIWNDKCIPAWWCNWTMNINLEMNYWPAYRCNLAECAEPLHQFIGRMAENGRKTAKVHYGCNGWTAHHMMDIWMDSTPIGFDDKPERDSASWAMWCFSGAWLCLHLWEHYQYTKDIKFLKEYAYPIMKEAQNFLWTGSFWKMVYIRQCHQLLLKIYISEKMENVVQYVNLLQWTWRLSANCLIV